MDASDKGKVVPPPIIPPTHHESVSSEEHTNGNIPTDTSTEELLVVQDAKINHSINKVEDA